MDTNERCFWPIVIIGVTKHWQLPQLHEPLQMVSGASAWEHLREQWFFYSERPRFEFCFFLDGRLWANCLISRNITFLIWKLGMKAFALQPCYQICVYVHVAEWVGVWGGMLLCWHVEGAQRMVVLMILDIINSNSYEGCKIQIFENDL